VSTQDSIEPPSTADASSGVAADHVAVVHLSRWLEAHSPGSITVYEVRIMTGHAARCPACRALLASDEEIRRRLALLRVGEPRIDVLGQVMQRIDEEA
jgi:predicted anti-sigma-YlaC factor YlaD